MKGYFEKRADGSLVACCENATKMVAAIKVGDGLSLEGRKARNLKFHRKFFALLNLGFDAWNPDPSSRYAELGIRKDFEKFREHITILAGHFEEGFSLDGDLVLKAKSISFAQMDELEFREVYSAVLGVVWDRVLRHENYESEDEVDRVVNELIWFSQ